MDLAMADAARVPAPDEPPSVPPPAPPGVALAAMDLAMADAARVPAPDEPRAVPPPGLVFPSISASKILGAETYTFSSPVPSSVTAADASDPVVLGVDEAGRGPVLGPMVYAAAYLPSSLTALLRSSSFDDSKKLTAAFRHSLFTDICTPAHALHDALGWSVAVMSPRDISAGMLRAAGAGAYNLNAQAHDTTIALIRGVLDAGVAVAEVYVDTVGDPGTYQTKLEKCFPGIKITVAKKADSLYPVVSAASVVAKVTRDAAVEGVLMGGEQGGDWDLGSGYPGDRKTKTWLRETLDPVFGWDPSVVRFSWGTVKNLLEEGKEALGVGVKWLDEEEAEGRIEGFFGDGGGQGKLEGWYGKAVQAEF